MDIKMWIIIALAVLVLLLLVGMWHKGIFANRSKKKSKIGDMSPEPVSGAPAKKGEAKSKQTVGPPASLPAEWKPSMQEMVRREVEAQTALYKNNIVELHTRVSRLEQAVRGGIQPAPSHQAAPVAPEPKRPVTPAPQPVAAPEAQPAAATPPAKAARIPVTRYFPDPIASSFLVEDGKEVPSDKMKFTITYEGDEGHFIFMPGILDALKNSYNNFFKIVETEGCSWEQAKSYTVLEKGKVVKKGDYWEVAKPLKVQLN